MLVLISPAKTMLESLDSGLKHDVLSLPIFQSHAEHIVELMQDYSSDEIESIFKVSASIARELRHRFKHFSDGEFPPLAAFDAYDGVVYKHFKPSNAKWNKTEIIYLQEHVLISSLLYGLLRPFDAVRAYRMEGYVHLKGEDIRVDKYWRDIQTQTLIDNVKQAGGTLIYLASKEEQKAFNWKDVEKNIDVIDVKFLQYKGDKLRQVVIHTKMARGEMIRYMIENKVKNAEDLKSFKWSGFTYREELSTAKEWVWVME